MLFSKVRRLPAGMATIGILSTLACGTDEVPGSLVARTDTIGDTIVVHTVAGSLWDGPAQLVETLTIGVLDGPEEYTFGEVLRMTEDREGGIYVFDRQGPLLRHYDRAGEYIGAVGRPGDGEAAPFEGCVAGCAGG